MAIEVGEGIGASGNGKRLLRGRSGVRLAFASDDAGDVIVHLEMCHPAID
jgi:hypothetical protein